MPHPRGEGSRGGPGAWNPRAKSGYTTLNVTLDTKRLLDQLRGGSAYYRGTPYDDLLHRLALDEIERQFANSRRR